LGCLDPFPLLDDVRVCFLDELAHSTEGFPAPVSEVGDSFRDELRCRLALGRARLFHVRILEVAVRRSPAWPARGARRNMRTQKPMTIPLERCMLSSGKR